jgi:sialic acid synthase SpsE
MIEVLRPAPADCIKPYDLDSVIGKRVRISLKAGEGLTWTMLENA